MSEKEFLNKISVWLKDNQKLVIAIDGYSGAGKTTLLKKIEKDYKDVLAVYMDDFILAGDKRSKLIKQAKDKSKVFELQWYDYSSIKELIDQFKKQLSDSYQNNIAKNYDLTKKILIIEGIFLFHPKLFKNIFDIKVFINVDLEKTDKRRIVREKKKWGKDYVPEDRLDSFVRLFKIAYRRYLKEYQPNKQADIVIKQ